VHRREGAPRRGGLFSTLKRAVAVTVPAAPDPPSGAARAARTTAHTDVTVIDVATGRRNSRQTVLISGDRIVAVGRNLPAPRGATTIDLTGRFVIPALADMHVHALDTDEVDPPLHLANGVTTVRLMPGDPRTYGRSRPRAPTSWRSTRAWAPRRTGRSSTRRGGRG
jgi:hypothetical protein